MWWGSIERSGQRAAGGGRRGVSILDRERGESRRRATKLLKALKALNALMLLK
jgi:hypothetical protein